MTRLPVCLSVRQAALEALVGLVRDLVAAEHVVVYRVRGGGGSVLGAVVLFGGPVCLCTHMQHTHAHTHTLTHT